MRQPRVGTAINAVPFKLWFFALACTGLACVLHVDPRPTLLAIASSAGWVHIYQPRVPGEHAWRRIHSGTHHGDVHMAFSPDGCFLVLAMGASS